MSPSVVLRGLSRVCYIWEKRHGAEERPVLQSFLLAHHWLWGSCHCWVQFFLQFLVRVWRSFSWSTATSFSLSPFSLWGTWFSQRLGSARFSTPFTRIAAIDSLWCSVWHNTKELDSGYFFGCLMDGWWSYATNHAITNQWCLAWCSIQLADIGWATSWTRSWWASLLFAWGPGYHSGPLQWVSQQWFGGWP